MVGFGVADGLLFEGVPFDGASEARGDIAEVAHDGRAVAFFDVCIGALAALDAVEEVAGVGRVEVVALHLQGLHGGRYFFAGAEHFGRDCETAAEQCQRALCAVDIQRKALALTYFAGGPSYYRLGELVSNFLYVGSLTAIGEGVGTLFVAPFKAAGASMEEKSASAGVKAAAQYGTGAFSAAVSPDKTMLK